MEIFKRDTLVIDTSDTYIWYFIEPMLKLGAFHCRSERVYCVTSYPEIYDEELTWSLESALTTKEDRGVVILTGGI